MTTGSGTGTPVTSLTGAYCSVADVKTQRSITSTTDDGLISEMIDAVEATIDRISQWISFAATADATKHIDCDEKHVEGAKLWLDYPLCQITSVTNGDSVAVAAASYVTLPESSPYYALKLKASTGLSWTYTTDPEQAITIVGRWGYSTTVPDVIKRLAIDATVAMYGARENQETEQTIIQGETIIVPRKIAKMIEDRLWSLGLVRI